MKANNVIYDATFFVLVNTAIFRDENDIIGPFIRGKIRRVLHQTRLK